MRDDRIRSGASLSRRPYRRRPANVLELAIEAIDEERRTEVVGMVFWSIAIAAEPIHAGTIRSMLKDSKLCADHLDDAIDALLDHGFVRLAGGPNTYCVKESWWPYLRAFGGHYDEKTMSPKETGRAKTEKIEDRKNSRRHGSHCN